MADKKTSKPTRAEVKQLHSDPVALAAQIKSNNIKKIEPLKLGKGQWKDILAAIENNRSIRKLDLSNVGMGDDGSQVLVRIIKKHPSLTMLNLRNNQFTQSGVKAIEEAVAANWRLVRVEVQEEKREDINPFLNLEMFNIEPCQKEIERICFVNACLKKILKGRLNRLRIKRRNLIEMPGILFTAANLVALDLSHNRIGAIPPAIKALSNLEYLLLADNQIQVIPPELGLLRKLVKLNLAANRIAAVPDALGLLVSLKELNVANNRLTRLPTILGSLKNMTVLRCSDNPWGPELRETAAAGDAMMLAVLRNAFLSGERVLNSVKLMFVGDGNVGKSTLLKAFLRGPQTKEQQKRLAAAPEPNVATDGIDITKWRAKGSDSPAAPRDAKAPADAPPEADASIEFNSWDFAGQEVYYSTHSFFISNKALYLIVFNLLRDPDTNRIEYWLQSIAARAGTAPVVLVGTHVDECSKEDAQAYLDKLRATYASRFKNIAAYAAVSTLTGKGVEKLKTLLLDIAEKQEWTRRIIPQNFYALLKKLEAMRETQKTPVLRWRAFVQMALDCEVAEADAALVADLFHHLGELIHFSEKDSGLADVVVLDPQWLTRTFATIISMKNTFARNGVMPRAALSQLWQAPAYPEEFHPFLLSLLRKFELLHELEGGGILVPTLVESARPADEELVKAWPHLPPAEQAQQLSRVYRFEFVPVGFFSRLMVRLMRLGWDATAYWRNGFVLSRAGSGGADRVFLELEPASHELRVRVRGPTALQQLHLLADGIATLVREWLQTPLRAAVPCPECIAASLQPPHMFELSECEECLRLGSTKKELHCKNGHAVAPDRLAPDVALLAFQRIPRASLKNRKRIGQGGFATVYSAELEGRPVAVKELDLPEPDPHGNDADDAITEAERLAVYNEFRREAWLMSSLQHPYCISMFGVVTEKPAIVMELMTLGSLYDYLARQDVTMSWEDRLRLASNIADAINHLHSSKPPIVHRDLKSPNVLLTHDNHGRVVAKVADVGAGGALSLVDAFKERLVMNPVWLAPEIMLKMKYNEKVDTYAYGVILWELATRQRYFGEKSFMSQIEKAVMSGQRPAIPADCWPGVVALIELCWAADPAQRPAFSQVLVWLQQILDTKGKCPDDLAAAVATMQAGAPAYLAALQADAERQIRLLQLEAKAREERTKSRADSRRQNVKNDLLTTASSAVALSASSSTNVMASNSNVHSNLTSSNSALSPVVKDKSSSVAPNSVARRAPDSDRARPDSPNERPK